ncbi:ras-related protein RIC1-like isoform X1 [Mizuhopecten yessoensis]|uniref:ras-related protein RIC1-like isoform X1 n=1 Tax=Mizuhopecten yessoensis TaxID=6573 RepID=UPI000B45BB25|nr:ras-related protein RIC1-like isoform X1 [Mizuhopecten yessoensis]
MSFPLLCPCLTPLNFEVDKWNFGKNMTLILHSLLNDIIEETHESKVLLYQPSEGAKSQRQHNIDFVQELSTEDIATIARSSNIKAKQLTAGGIRYRQRRRTEDNKRQSPSIKGYMTSKLTKDTAHLNNKLGVQKEPYVDLKVKVIFLGASGVGKTRTFETFEIVNKEKCHSKHVKQYHSNHMQKTSNLKLPRKATYDSVVKRTSGTVKMIVCDTAGQERYRSLTSSYYRGTHGCLILFDVRKGHTFDSVQSWYNDLEAYCTSPEMISTILVGNNCDAEDREVPKEKAVKLAEHIGIPYMEIRSDNTQTVNDVFEALADMIIDTYKVHPSLDTISTSTRLPKPSHKHRTWCSC